MKFLAKAIVTGFGLSVGAALFKKVSSYVGLDDEKKKKEEEADKVTTRDGATDPALQH